MQKGPAFLTVAFSLLRQSGSKTWPNPPSATSAPWGLLAAMAHLNGRDVYDWLPVIAGRKRAGQPEEALDIALACINAFSGTVPIKFLTHATILQHSLGLFDDEITLLSTALRGSYNTADVLELHKRLAKAQEARAKREGDDPGPFRARWRELVDKQKSLPKPRPKFLPTAEELAEQEFVAVDFETANRRGALSACQIALTKIRDGRVVGQYNTLLRPPAGFEHFEFSWLHGITFEDVAEAPRWPTVAAEVAEFVGSLPTYAHNAGFDQGVWAALDRHFHTSTLPERFYCTVLLSRRTAPGLDNHKLPTVTDYYAPGFELNHHRADSDAEACALIVAALQQDPGVSTLLT